MPSSGRQGNGRHGARACVFCVGPFYSESSADVAHAITYAKSLGARVVLGPLVDPNWALRSNHRGSPAYPGAECILWRAGKVPGMVQPANCTMHGSPPTAERGPVGEFFSEAQWDAWFASYGAMMLTHARLAQANGTRHEPFNSTPMVANSISSGSPHVRPTGRTCGEPDEIKRNTHPKYFTALFREQARTR